MLEKRDSELVKARAALADADLLLGERERALQERERELMVARVAIVEMAKSDKEKDRELG